MEAASHLFLPHFDRHLLPAACTTRWTPLWWGSMWGTNALAAVGTTAPSSTCWWASLWGVLRRHGDYLSNSSARGTAKTSPRRCTPPLPWPWWAGLSSWVLGLLTPGPLWCCWACRGDTGRRLDLHERVLLRHHRQHDIQRRHRRAAAIGDSRMPLYVLIVCCLVNIVLDLLFVLGFHWDSLFGVAIATVLSQVVSARCLSWRG